MQAETETGRVRGMLGNGSSPLRNYVSMFPVGCINKQAVHLRSHAPSLHAEKQQRAVVQTSDYCC